MIRSFADKVTAKIFDLQPSKSLPRDLEKTALKKLMLLDVADALDDLSVPPSNRLEKL
jgi:proteic killer suppression protein